MTTMLITYLKLKLIMPERFITKQNRVFKLNQGKRIFSKKQLEQLRNQPVHIPASQMSAKDISDLKGRKQQFLVSK